MAAFYPALLSLVLMALTLTSYHRYSSHERASTSSVSKKRGAKNLTVYAMAVGQGDGNIILCPNGRDIVIVDMGAVQRYKYASTSYGGYLLKQFGALNKNIHIVVTHPDEDHYSFLPDSFHKDGQLIKNVKEIVLGGSYDDYSKERFRSWLNKIRAEVPVYTVNNEHECFSNSECIWTPPPMAAINNDRYVKKPTSDDLWQFCGDDVNIIVLGANICGKNNGCSPNGRSIVLKFVYKDWSLLLSGDFEGKGQQDKLMNHSPQPMQLQSTYYKVTHHGSWKPDSIKLLRAINPRRAYVSSAHPMVNSYSHPRCEVFDYLINLGSISTTNTRNSVDCCSKKLRGSCRLAESKLGHMIYETCRCYDYKSGCQTCQDIEITTDGYNDYTVYRSVPDKYVNPSSINCQRPQCMIK